MSGFTDMDLKTDASRRNVVIAFRNGESAGYLVAGIPAAARAVREVALAADGEEALRCWIVTGKGRLVDARCRSECARLAPGIAIRFAVAGDRDIPEDAIVLPGEALTGAGQVAAVLAGSAMPGETPGGDIANLLADLRRKGDAIVAATGKPGDGIVSRYLNRPVSRTFTRALLRIPQARPVHATCGTAALGVMMAFAILLGGPAGLVAGAVLFQCASIFDGVDGEMARATFRSSDAGARLDSLVDGWTNLAFFACMAVNVALAGRPFAAAAGLAGMVMLATGLFFLGRRAKALGQPVNFDGVKVHLRQRGGRLADWLIWLTMRDFIAAAAVVVVIAGFAAHALMVFAAIALIWLCVTLVILVRSRGALRAARI